MYIASPHSPDIETHSRQSVWLGYATLRSAPFLAHVPADGSAPPLQIIFLHLPVCPLYRGSTVHSVSYVCSDLNVTSLLSLLQWTWGEQGVASTEREDENMEITTQVSSSLLQWRWVVHFSSALSLPLCYSPSLLSLSPFHSLDKLGSSSASERTIAKWLLNLASGLLVHPSTWH